MPDPRNVAHDQTVQQKKKNHHEPIAPADAAEAVQPGRKPTLKHHAGDAKKNDADKNDATDASSVGAEQR